MKLKDPLSATPTLLELKADNKLLDPEFSGYKLSLSPIPVHSITFDSRVNKVGPTEGQFSLQHATLFATQNLLFPNPAEPNSVYFVDVDWNVWKIATNPLNGRLGSRKHVWTVPGKDAKNIPGRFNLSIVFPTPGYALLADGCGNVFLLDVNEDDSKKWEEIYTVPHEPTKASVLLDSVYHKEAGAEKLDILVMRIEEKAGFIEEHHLEQHKNLAGDHMFLNIIEWLSLKKGFLNGLDGDNSWSVASRRQLAGQTGVQYGYLEPGGNSAYIACDTPFYLTFDSEHPVVPPEVEEVSDLERKPDFLWTQTKDDITVFFSLAVSSRKEDVGVNVKSESISVSFKNETMLEGSLYGHVKPDSLVWTLESGKLEITFDKSEEQIMWPELVPGNLTGEHIVDEETVQSIHSRLAHLCSDKWESSSDPVVLAENDFDGQLEECDRLSDDSALLMRFTKGSHNYTHQVSLTTHPILFSVRVNPSEPPNICMRYLNDGLIWQSEEPSDSDWKLKHVGTFSALGYVQAGKSQRKFTFCAPDLSYVALCDAVKHIYIYRRPERLENTELRNRKTGVQVKHVATQQIISVDPAVEVLGAVAFPEFLFILTANHLHAYKVKETTEEDL